MNKEIELKPCPFCEKPPVFYADARFPQWVGCNNCAITHGRYSGANETDHFDRWNTRPVEAQLQAENERLSATLESVKSLCAEYEGGVADAIKEFLEAALQHNEEAK